MLGLIGGSVLLALGILAIVMDVASGISAARNRDPNFVPVTTAPVGTFIGISFSWVGARVIRRNLKPDVDREEPEGDPHTSAS